MSFQQLYVYQQDARKAMADAKDAEEKAYWINLYRWITEEIKRLTTSEAVSA